MAVSNEATIGRTSGRSGVAFALAAIFCISGASGLAYEVLWTRQMSFVLGGSALAVSTVLAVFMGGLGLGSFLGGRIADRTRRPLHLYAVCQVLIALFGLMTPTLLSASGSVYLELHRLLGATPLLSTIARAIAASLIMLVPTTLMGATLPFVVRFFVRRVDRLGRGLGLLYGVNTMGGVIGAGYMGYYSVLQHGVQHSIVIASAGNFLAGVGALLIALLARGREYDAVPPEARAAEPPGVPPRPASAAPAVAWSDDRSIVRLLYIAFAVSGFTSFAYQVLWTRMLNFAIGNSVYAFTTILVVVLTGLFIGAFVSGPLADRTKRPFLLLGTIQLLVVAAAVATYLTAPMLPGFTTTLVARFGAGTHLSDAVTKVIPAAILLLMPCFFLGLTFPLALKVAIGRLERLGDRLGRCYAINTIGAIVGSLVAGYVLLSTLGLERSIFIIISANSILAFLFLRRAERMARPLTAVAALGATAVLLVAFVLEPMPFIQHTSLMKGGNRRIVYHEEGRTANVAVTEMLDRQGRVVMTEMFINLLGASACDREYRSQQYFNMISLLPTALHPAPEKVFVVGVASGVTSGASLLDERTKRKVSVEISPEVIRAAHYFEEYNYGVMRNPRAEIIADDARIWLTTTEERFDIIVTDAFLSAVTGTCNLYSLDYFILCSRRLAPGGLMSVGVGSLQGTDRTVARTFLEAFPYVACFVVESKAAYNRTFLIGANEPFAIDRAWIDAVYAQPQVQRELARYGMPDPEALIGSYLCDRETLLPLLEGTTICTDDLPVIDFQAISWAEGFSNKPVAAGMRLDEIVTTIGRQPFPFSGTVAVEDAD